MPFSLGLRNSLSTRTLSAESSCRILLLQQGHEPTRSEWWLQKAQCFQLEHSVPRAVHQGTCRSAECKRHFFPAKCALSQKGKNQVPMICAKRGTTNTKLKKHEPRRVCASGLERFKTISARERQVQARTSFSSVAFHAPSLSASEASSSLLTRQTLSSPRDAAS